MYKSLMRFYLNVNKFIKAVSIKGTNGVSNTYYQVLIECPILCYYIGQIQFLSES